MNRYLSSNDALNKIGARIKAYRIDYPLTQGELANKSGVAVRSISRMESGEDVQLGSLIKVLIALELDANLDMLIPDPAKRPSFYLKENYALQKKRVRKGKSAKQSTDIRWGDEDNE